MRRRRVPPILQLTQTECGLCSCAMVLRAHGGRESLARLRAEFEIGRDGLSLPQMVSLLERRGFDVRLFRANLGGVRSIDLPAVLFWENRHFVVLERVTQRSLVIVDPASGRRVLRPDEFEAGFSGIVLVPTATERFAPRKVREASVWAELLTSLRQSRRRLALIALISCAVYGVTLGVPRLTQELVDRQVSARSLTLDTAVMAIIAAVIVAHLTLLIARVGVVTATIVAVGRQLMQRTFGHLLQLPYRYFGSRSPGELMYRLSSVNSIRDMIAGQLVTGVLDCGMLVAVLAFMAHKSLYLTGIAVSLFAAICLLLLLTHRRVAEAIQNEMTETSRSQAMQLEAVVSISSLKIAGMEQSFFNDWAEVFDSALAKIRRRSLLQGAVNSTVTVIQTAGPFLLLLLGLQRAIAGDLSLGDAVAFQALTATYFGLASSIFGSYTQYLIVRSFLDRLVDIVRSEPQDRSGPTLRPDIRGNVSVRDVSFAYSDNAPLVLDGISFDVSPGQKVAIVGSSGSGKSTISKLLTGLYHPTGGEIYYEDLPIGVYEHQAFYEQIGLVPQEISLQNRSIRENITLGMEKATTAEVEAAARAAQIHEEIMDMPMGYETLVSEMGQNLSGGQRQRVVLARAILKAPRVLILDEATSSLDVYNERRISDHLRQHRCTHIVIAHRLSTVVDADLVLVLSRGRVVDRGTHAELSEREGPYRTLFQSQLRPDIPLPVRSRRRAPVTNRDAPDGHGRNRSAQVISRS
jgi:ABC-type bacteriocin/lantibiotic exporter with double-glycine peptidase domain